MGQSIRPFSIPGNPSSSEASKIVFPQGESYRRLTTIGMLTDDVLLDIFDSYRHNHDISICLVWDWHLLVHVCRRWRQIIFESPHRLNLQILCTHRTSVLNLGIWPAFPIAIDYIYTRWDIPSSNNEDNVIAALEHPDRVCRINLYVTGSQLAKMAAVMQVPFPVLTHLSIALVDGETQVLPSRFLGGSAPCLQELHVQNISYPALPTLLLFTNDLIILTLTMPQFGYISPEAMVVILAALPKLETLHIELQSSFSHIHLPRPHVTRIVLPALTSFHFTGNSEYLEKLVAQLDGPQLSRIRIAYMTVDFPFVQLSKFVDRSVGPELTLLNHAQVGFFGGLISFTMSDGHARHYKTRTIISCEAHDGQVSYITELLGQFSATEVLSHVLHLELEGWTKDNVEWLHLLRQFSAVQTLRVSPDLVGHIAFVLENIMGEMVTEVLPSLNLICLEGHSASSVGRFVAARELSNRPVTIFDTTTEFSNRLESSVSN